MMEWPLGGSVFSITQTNSACYIGTLCLENEKRLHAPIYLDSETSSLITSPPLLRQTVLVHRNH